MKFKSSRLLYFGIVLFFVMMTAGISSTAEVNVEFVSHVGGTVSDVAVVGDYGYIGQGQDLVVLDIRDTANPLEVGRLNIPSYIADIDVSDKYACLVDGYSLFIVDISNPSSPKHMGKCDIDISGYVYGVAVSDKYAYVVDGYGLVIVDITDPASPKIASRYDIDVYGDGYPAGRDVDVSGKYAYVAGDDGCPVVSILDITDPYSPTLVSSYGLSSDLGTGITISGKYAYVGLGFPGLEILDISNPTSPRYVGAYGEFGPADFTTQVAIEGNYAYIPKESGLEILDISNPSTPTLAGSYATTNPAIGVAVSDNNVYLAAGNSGLLILRTELKDQIEADQGAVFEIIKPGAIFEGPFDDYDYGTYPMRMEVTDVDGNEFSGILHWPTLRDSKTKFRGTIDSEQNKVWFTEYELIQGSNIVLNGNYYAELTGSTLSGYWNLPSGRTRGTFSISLQDVTTSGNIIPTTSPVSVTNTESPTPTISWTYNDADGDPQLQYELEVWTGQGVTRTRVWTASQSSMYTSVTYGGNPLTGGTAYYIRVKAYDGSDWSEWSETLFVPFSDLVSRVRAQISIMDNNNPLSYFDEEEASNYMNTIGILKKDEYNTYINNVVLYRNLQSKMLQDALIQAKKGNTAKVDRDLNLAVIYGQNAAISFANANNLYLSILNGGIFVAKEVQTASLIAFKIVGTAYGLNPQALLYVEMAVTAYDGIIIDGKTVTQVSVDVARDAFLDSIVNIIVFPGLEGKTMAEYLSSPELWRGHTDKEIYLTLSSVLESDEAAKIVFSELQKQSPDITQEAATQIWEQMTNQINKWLNSESAYQEVRIKSPGELRVYDSLGRVTGLVNGETVEEIPNSVYDNANKSVILLDATDLYKYDVIGTGTGEYGLDILSVRGMKYSPVSLQNTIIPNEVHQYTVDWNSISTERVVALDIDSNNDGTFDTNKNMQLPTASFVETPSANEIISFNGSSSIGNVVSYIWDFGDGTSGSGVIVDHTYSAAGVYTVVLTVSNENGKDSWSKVISLTTSSSSSSGSGGGSSGGSSSSKTSSGGGGGGAGSAEDYSNVAMKDVDTQYLRMNANVTYEFMREGNPIQSVSFYSLKNSGEITSTIEVLNNRSKLVNSTPEGSIYKYVNIWVGKSGFATAANIKDAKVKFKVNNSWLQDMALSPADVKLQRHNGTAWEVLPTTMESNATGYVTFEAQTPSFSPFAITAEKVLASSRSDDMDAKYTQTEDVGINGTQPEKTPGFGFSMAILIVGVFAGGYVYLKRRQN